MRSRPCARTRSTARCGSTRWRWPASRRRSISCRASCRPREDEGGSVVDERVLDVVSSVSRPMKPGPMKPELLDRIGSRDLEVAVVGLGSVGLPLANAFVEAGFRVLGIDVD